MAALSKLPTELLHLVLSFLEDEQPHSIKRLHEEPSELVFRSDYHPIKDLSRTCQRLRQLTFSSLFNNIKVNLEDIENLIPFIHRSSLRGVSSTLTLHASNGSMTTFHSLCSSTDASPWCHILALIECLDPESLTILVPPPALGVFLPYSLRLFDEWAFNKPYHLLHLSHARDLIRRDPDPVPPPDQNIFKVRPWTHCTYNEGSSISPYGIYEYFHKSAATLFECEGEPANMFHAILGSMPRLRSFDYIAVFPFPHIRKFTPWLNSIAPNLAHLRIQLAPTRNNGILDDPEALGTCQRSALWTEFEIAYVRLIQCIDNGTLLCLNGFTILDYANIGLRDMLDRMCGELVFHGEKPWVHEGNGLWTTTSRSV